LNSQPPDSADSQAQVAPPPETPAPAPETEKRAPGVSAQFNLPGTPPAAQSSDVAIVPVAEIHFPAATNDPTEAARPSLPLAVQETHFATPDLPRASTSSEILLHLTGNDQAPAAIRVADRAGAVNVSVHTSDPVLRESLRSNLGQLSAQLSAQGWKAEVTKTAAVTTHPEGRQDSHSQGQRGSQQQPSGAYRQQQRDRRANGGQWQNELDQQITGGDAHPGGTR